MRIQSILLWLVAFTSLSHSNEMVSLSLASPLAKDSLLDFRITRCGHHLGRIENAYDSLGHREMFITRDRQTWMIHIPRKTGQLIEDIAPSYDLIIPILMDSSLSKGKPQMQWGREFDFFTPKKDTSTQEIHWGAYTYILEQRQGKPWQMTVKQNGHILQQLRYRRYETQEQCVDSLFAIPDSIDFSKSSSKEAMKILMEWPLPSSEKTYKDFTPVGILIRIHLMRKMLMSNPEPPVLGFLAGFTNSLDSLELLDIKDYAKKNPKHYGSFLFQKSRSLNVAKLQKALIKDASQLDFFWAHYYATRELADLEAIANCFLTNNAGFAPNLPTAKIEAIRKSALWSMKSHFRQLPFFAEDLRILIQASSDPLAKETLQEIWTSKGK